MKHSEFRVGTGLYARYVTPPVACGIRLAPGDHVRLCGTVYRVVRVEPDRLVPGAEGAVADRVTVDPAPSWYRGAEAVAYEWSRGRGPSAAYAEAAVAVG